MVYLVLKFSIVGMKQKRIGVAGIVFRLIPIEWIHDIPLCIVMIWWEWKSTLSVVVICIRVDRVAIGRVCPMVLYLVWMRSMHLEAKC
jgi:hypothetical protein